VVHRSRPRRHLDEGIPLTPTERQVVLGGVLGDACLSALEGQSRVTAWLSMTHTNPQFDYLQFKAQLLARILTVRGISRKKIRSSEIRGKRVSPHIAFSCITVCLPELYHLRCLCYGGPVDAKHKNGTKRITQEWLDQIDELGLAIWFMDDGNCRRPPQCHFFRARFSLGIRTSEELTTILTWFAERWGLHAICYAGEGGKQSMLDIYRRDDATRFFNLIAPHIPLCMRYKLPDGQTD
jgi:hypothetical protein